MAVMLEVNRKRIQRLMRIPGIEALYPEPNLSCPAVGREIYPYLLRGVSVERPNQVWSSTLRCMAASSNGPMSALRDAR
jgi:putative transposase